MSRGPGWVQLACLQHIKEYEEDDDWPTAYDIAAAVYQVKPDEDGISYVTDAQYVAVKRALEGLQLQGRIIGFRTLRRRGAMRDYIDKDGKPFRIPDDHRAERCHHWMTEKRAQQYVRDQLDMAHKIMRMGWFGGGGIAFAERIKKKMQAIGMALDEDNPERKGSNPGRHAGGASQWDQVN
jgi:hypothetical protein